MVASSSRFSHKRKHSLLVAAGLRLLGIQYASKIKMIDTQNNNQSAEKHVEDIAKSQNEVINIFYI